MQFLALATNLEANEMAQVLKRNLALDLNLERQRTTAIGPRLLPHLHNEFARFRLREDELATDREKIISLREIVRCIRLIRGEGAGLPDPGNLQMQMIAVTASGINHPEMGLIHRQMFSQVRTPQHNRFKFNTAFDSENTSGELILVLRV